MIALASLLALVSAQAANAAPAEAPATTAGRFFRAAFLVKDMDASRALYEDALGMIEQAYTEPFRDPVLSALLGFDAPVTMEIIVLDGGGQRLALMRPLEGGLAERDDAPMPGAGVTLLFSHRDLHAVAEAVETVGGEVVRPPAPPGTHPDALYAIGPSGERLIVTWGVLD